LLSQWAKSPKNSLKECVFANWTPKIQWHIVKNTLLHISLLLILAPIIPPPNVTNIDRYSTNKLRLTWDEIPEQYQRGYMVGYKIRYQLVRQSGQDISVGNAPVLLEFDRFVFEHEITGLLPYAEYKVDIFGYAFEGDGPEHTYFAGENL